MQSENYMTTNEFLKFLKDQYSISLTKRTLRYYISEGLIPHPAKIGGNKAHYYKDEANKLSLIFMLKKSGHTLEKIKQIVKKDDILTYDSYMDIKKQSSVKIIERLVDAIVSNITKMPKEAVERYVEDLQKNIFNSVKTNSQIGGYIEFLNGLKEFLEKYFYIFENTEESSVLARIKYLPNRYLSRDDIKKVKFDIKRRMNIVLNEHNNLFKRDLKKLK